VGALLVLTMSILLILAMLGVVSQLQGSSTARALRRMQDHRACIEAGEAAIAEAVSLVRRSMDDDSTSPECPDPWRSSILHAMEGRAAPPRARFVLAQHTRAVYRGELPALQISPVRVDVVDVHVPPVPQPGQDITGLQLPQGVIQFSVEVTGAQKLFSVRRKIRERRGFFVYADPAAAVDGVLDTTGALFTLFTNPMGTVIE
jgi:hypothetical protein